MGLFELFKRKKAAQPAVEPVKARAYGWDAITAAFQALYPGQTNPPHRAPTVFRMHDLSDNAAAFDGISAYDAGAFWHLVSYGLTELYGKESIGTEPSGFGFELTFRVPKTSEAPPLWAFDLLEAIGKSVWRGMKLGAGHTLKTGPLDGRAGTPEDAILVVRDPTIPEPLDTPNGQVEFLLLIGVQDAVRQRVLEAYDAGARQGWEGPILAELRASNPDLITPIDHTGDWGG